MGKIRIEIHDCHYLKGINKLHLSVKKMARKPIDRARFLALLIL